MKILKNTFFTVALLASSFSNAGSSWIGGKVTSLLAHGTEPAIRLTGNASPDNCDGGSYGWLNRACLFSSVVQISYLLKYM